MGPCLLKVRTSLLLTQQFLASQKKTRAKSRELERGLRAKVDVMNL